jgi:hypothetical protein
VLLTFTLFVFEKLTLLLLVVVMLLLEFGPVSLMLALLLPPPNDMAGVELLIAKEALVELLLEAFPVLALPPLVLQKTFALPEVAYWLLLLFAVT